LESLFLLPSIGIITRLSSSPVGIKEEESLDIWEDAGGEK